MKIITMSEPECGGKPTGYAAIIPNGNRDTAKRHILMGLQKGWHTTESLAESMVTEDDLDNLKAQGYTYLDGWKTILVEITTLDEEKDETDGGEPRRVFSGGTHWGVYAPFSAMKVSGHGIVWDSTDGDDGDEGSMPPSDFSFTLTAKELFDNDIIVENDNEIDWDVNFDALTEYAGERISDFSGFCTAQGWTPSFTPVP